MAFALLSFSLLNTRMPAETLNCPMCGAPASSESTSCDHCGARLATVACPSCFGMMFVGSKFCSHCGAKADRKDVASGVGGSCPRCHTPMETIVIGKTNLRECPRCEGIWADVEALDQICADRENQAAVLGTAQHLPEPESELEEKVRYLPCPVCDKLMNRVNFAKCSHVVVDVCKGHGTWFDKDELRRIVEFIRAGGLDAARDREKAELEEQERQARAATLARGSQTISEPSYDDWGFGISIAGSILKKILQ